jgi:homoserine kinase
MALVDRLRERGHAAVISGAGPSVLVLTTRRAAPAAEQLVPEAWRVVRPGVPATGAEVLNVAAPRR